ncbi:MAG: restriction endonuclease subunit S, partial [Firmicutes bacterium]|nr:restriction endonuclease subunit S [Bacillota bacterium]
MNKIDQLIKQFCPNGIEYKMLGEIAEFKNNGVDKKSIEGQNAVMLLNFVDVFRNKYLYKNTLTMQVTANERQIVDCNIKVGDIFITPSSEILNEIGRAAVAKEDIVDGVYSYHIARIRLFDKSKINPEFIRYLFESQQIQSQINQKAQGLTRFGLTKPKWESLNFPLPPLPIQQSIVSILDKFTELTAELTAELEARRKQYEYYRDRLLTFDERG